MVNKVHNTSSINGQTFKALKSLGVIYRIENGKEECVKETTTRRKSKNQHKVINGQSTQQEDLAPGDKRQLVL